MMLHPDSLDWTRRGRDRAGELVCQLQCLLLLSAQGSDLRSQEPTWMWAGCGGLSLIPALIRCIRRIYGASWLARSPMSAASGIR